MSERVPMRNCEFRVHKAGGMVDAFFRGPAVVRRAQDAVPIRVEDICSIDTESLTSGGDLTTLLVPVQFHDRGVLIETPDGRGMLEKVFAAMWQQAGWPEVEERPSRTAQRRRRGRGGTHRDGERQTLSPKLAVFFNFPYDIGRLLADRHGVLRTLAAGADSYEIALSEEWRLEIRKMVLGNASSFDWRIRHPSTKTAMRLLGIDMTGYWKTSLANAAKSLGITEKIDIETMIENIYERSRESLNDEEWELFKSYALGDVRTTVDLYTRTCELLVKIDSRVVRKNGVIPPSAPGASARMVFAKAFDKHDHLHEWKRYPAWADQMGCDSYYGGRAFCRRPGIHSLMASFDLKSAYPSAMAQLPDPVTVQMSRIHEGRFVLEWYRGRYGVLCVSGTERSDTMPAFRVHDDASGGRLRYVSGAFHRQWVTIPECVIGVLRGTLTIDRVHDGVVMIGSSEESFIRAGIADFFAIKEDKNNEKALQDMAKLLANSFYGKLIEVTCTDYMIGEEILMPLFEERGEIARTIALIFACSGIQNPERVYWGKDGATQKLAMAEYRRAAEKLVIPGAPDAAVAAIYCYVEALNVAGEPRLPDKSTTVGRYVSGFKHYKCGQYFMPVYASQVTGLTSAMVGLMAECLNAWQGDTDSVHFQLPEGMTSGTLLPGYERYFDVMKEAGYHAPRKLADGSWYDAILEASPNLGSWEEECPEPSLESILVRPKLYSHKFHEGSLPKGGTYKQARHGFAKFHTPAIAEILRDMKLPRAERMKKAEKMRQAELHRGMRAVYEKGEFEYDTRPAPLRLRTAIKSGRTPGRFETRLIKMMQTTDPNNYLGDDQLIHWIGEGFPRPMKETG